MREIGIHLEGSVITILKSIFKARNIGGAQTKLAGAMQRVYTRVLSL